MTESKKQEALLRQQRDAWMTKVLDYLKSKPVPLEISPKKDGWVYQITVKWKGHELVLVPEGGSIIDGKPSYSVMGWEYGMDRFARITDTPELKVKSYTPQPSVANYRTAADAFGDMDRSNRKI
jgi:hypothetical protein